MPRPSNRKEALAGLRVSIAEGKAIIGAGAGIGLSAKMVEEGGADLIVIYNSGRYRMAGRGSLAGLMPYGNANDVVEEMAGEVLPVVRRTAVLAGVCASDPFRDLPRLLERLRDLGFAGVQNFPTVGLVDRGSRLRAGLEETGMGYGREVEMVRRARALGMLTTPYVFCAEDAAAMAAAGADVLVAHMGLTTSGSVGAASGPTLDECVELIREIRDAVPVAAGRRGGRGGKGEEEGDGGGEEEEGNHGIILLCHGGPIARPADAAYVMERVPGLHGFYGASSMERLPVEEAIAGITREFKSLKPAPAA